MITPGQIRGARAMLGLTQASLAKGAGISATGLNNIERGSADPKASTLRAIQAALESAGVVFITENGGGPGVRLRDRLDAPISFQRFVWAAEITDDPEGDFLKDARSDRQMPNIEGWDQLERYLLSKSASSPAIEAARKLWERFENQRARL